MSNVVDHPAAALMNEVEFERAVARTPEGWALQLAICKAMNDYYDYLDRHGLLYEAERDLVRASALCVSYDGCSYEFNLENGAIDRRYGDGKDPDPGRGLNPTWPPSKFVRH